MAKIFKKGLDRQAHGAYTCNQVKTVEGEQVISEPSFAESRRRWDCGMENRNEWAPEGKLNNSRRAGEGTPLAKAGI